jgi:hypothetical protein
LGCKEYMTTSPTTATEGAVSSDRSRRWLSITGGIQFGSFLLYPMFICGCHFHAEAIPAGLAPILWGFYPFFSYRTRREHWVGLLNGALAIFWLYFVWDSNLQFALTR